MIGSEIEDYNNRYHELAGLCPHMVTPEYKGVKKYLGGLAPEIESLVSSSDPATVTQAIRIAQRMTDLAVNQGKLPKRGEAAKTFDNKRKWENNNSKTPNHQS